MYQVKSDKRLIDSPQCSKSSILGGERYTLCNGITNTHFIEHFRASYYYNNNIYRIDVWITHMIYIEIEQSAKIIK